MSQKSDVFGVVVLSIILSVIVAFTFVLRKNCIENKQCQPGFHAEWLTEKGCVCSSK